MFGKIAGRYPRISLKRFRKSGNILVPHKQRNVADLIISSLQKGLCLIHSPSENVISGGHPQLAFELAEQRRHTDPRALRDRTRFEEAKKVALDKPNRPLRRNVSLYTGAYLGTFSFWTEQYPQDLLKNL